MGMSIPSDGEEAGRKDAEQNPVGIALPDPACAVQGSALCWLIYLLWWRFHFKLEDVQSKASPITDLIGPYFNPGSSIQRGFLILGP